MTNCCLRAYRLFIAAVTLCAIAVAATARAENHAQDKGLLWQLSDGKRTAYVLGSIHFGTDDLYPLAATIMDAYRRSDALVVEVNLLAIDQASLAQQVMAKGMYPSLDNNLKHNIDPSTWSLLEQTAPRYGMPIEFLQQQKPWMVALNLTLLAAKQAGYSEELGIDMHFLRQAERDAKPIIELETMAQQLDLFSQLSADEQSDFLSQTLRDIDRGSEFFAAMFSAWRAGNADDIDRLINSSLSYPGSERLYRLLLTDRNIAMARSIFELLSQGKTPFVVVGAGHLVGSTGLVALFQEQGFVVQQR